MKIRLSEIVCDPEVHPRGGHLDTTNVREIVNAIEAGAAIPPIVIESASKRIVDGFHRYAALNRLAGDEDSVVEVEAREYASDADLVLDSMRLNATHGRKLSPFDRAHCLIIADRLSIDEGLVAEALNITIDRLGTIRATKIGGTAARPITLKNTIRHLAGRRLTKKQEQANGRLGGMSQKFYVNQLLELLDAELIDRGNEPLMERLAALHEKLGELLGALSARG